MMCSSSGISYPHACFMGVKLSSLVVINLLLLLLYRLCQFIIIII